LTLTNTRKYGLIVSRPLRGKEKEQSPPLYYRAQGTGHRVHGTGHMVPGTGHRVQGTGCMVHGTGYRVQGTWYRVHGTWYMVQGTWYMVQGRTLRVTEVLQCTVPVIAGRGRGKSIRDWQESSSRVWLIKLMKDLPESAAGPIDGAAAPPRTANFPIRQLDIPPKFPAV
jgi:hypothetical protein